MKLFPLNFLKVIAGLAALGAAGVASADSLKISTNVSSNGGSGGSYSIQILNGPANNLAYSSLAIMSAGTFESFCLEPLETFSSGHTYNYTIGNSAIGGGLELASRNVGAGDRLSIGTSWLYSQFAMGTLLHFNYGASRKDSNLKLQQAIWHLEDDLPTYSATQIAANPFLGLVATHFGSITAGQANAGVNGAYGVQVLNLTSGTYNQHNHQSQLYFVGVPDEGSALFLLGLGLTTLAMLRRKFSR